METDHVDAPFGKEPRMAVEVRCGESGVLVVGARVDGPEAGRLAIAKHEIVAVSREPQEGETTMRVHRLLRVRTRVIGILIDESLRSTWRDVQ